MIHRRTIPLTTITGALLLALAAPALADITPYNEAHFMPLDAVRAGLPHTNNGLRPISRNGAANLSAPDAPDVSDGEPKGFLPLNRALLVPVRSHYTPSAAVPLSLSLPGKTAIASTAAAAIPSPAKHSSSPLLDLFDSPTAGTIPASFYKALRGGAVPR